jgi:hypothetical protein
VGDLKRADFCTFALKRLFSILLEMHSAGLKKKSEELGGGGEFIN